VQFQAGGGRRDDPERVYTVGNPSGLSKTPGEGLISGLREHNDIRYVQITAPISAGSSGGALVDSQGALVGITSFLLKDAQNINFAIAAEDYWRCLPCQHWGAPTSA
jgi:serine protease Do